MNQFEFQISKGAATHTVNCTARSASKAHDAIATAYGPGFTLNPVPTAVRTPHYFYNEIDATA